MLRWGCNERFSLQSNCSSTAILIKSAGWLFGQAHNLSKPDSVTRTSCNLVCAFSICSFFDKLILRLFCFITQFTVQIGRRNWMCLNAMTGTAYVFERMFWAYVPSSVQMNITFLTCCHCQQIRPILTRSVFYPQHSMFFGCNYLHYLPESPFALFSSSILHSCNDPVSPRGIIKVSFYHLLQSEVLSLCLVLHTSQRYMSVRWGYRVQLHASSVQHCATAHAGERQAINIQVMCSGMI